jgi:hypothetical protein
VRRRLDDADHQIDLQDAHQDAQDLPLRRAELGILK